MHILYRYAITFENWFIFATFDFQAVNIVPLSHYNQLVFLYIATHASSLKHPTPILKNWNCSLKKPFGGLIDSSFIQHGSRMVPGQKNILSGGRHLIIWRPLLIIWRPLLIIWRPPLNIWGSPLIIWRPPFNYLAAPLKLSGGRQINWAIFESACAFARGY